MKPLKYILLLGIVILFNCDELKDALPNEIDITTTYVNTINVSTPLISGDPEADVSFQDAAAFDFLNNPDVAEYVGTPEQIKAIQILNIQYEYKNFSGNVDAESLNSFFAIATAFMAVDTFPVANTNFAESDAFGTLFTVTGDFSNVNEFISESKVFSSVYGGTSTHNPADFSVEMTITVRLTLEVNPDDL
ncbi:hypothetical protein [Winogradskyella sp. 3972H.M.0a.05]|uniref:hypothetical protein n=1 Tax=Winogradskyella sp. 3972H.M.0a.05 TaxID=2950277 RepID=UPI0033974B8B